VFSRSKKKVAAKAGNMVIFPSWVRHEVPPNRCEGRSIIAGNFYYMNIKKMGPQYYSTTNNDAI
jgi:predicted 2-oxoglutarate/Fe(II)-dependent dioxygenase YbiX